MCDNRVMSVARGEVGVLESMAGVRAAEIGAHQWGSMLNLLIELRAHSLWNYTHGLRVGLYASALAEKEGTDPLLSFYGGAGHDLGKIRVSPEVLDSDEFGEEERELLRAHPRDGYDILKETFPMSALVAGIHHSFQVNAYGIDIDKESPVPLLGGVRTLVVEAGRLVAACDFFDAWTTRPRREGDVGPVKEAMENHGISAERIAWLVANDLSKIVSA